MACVDSGSTKPKQRFFLLTGYSGKEKDKLISIIYSLKASVFTDKLTAESVRSCTHVIAKKPCRSEKFLCSCASGKWILCSRYLVDSYRSKTWMHEEEYEWSNLRCTNEAKAKLAKASTRWRNILNKNNGKPAFHGCFIGLMVKKSFDVFNRLIKVGGGEAVDISINKNAEVTLVVADFALAKDVVEYHKRGIPCVRCEYLAERIVQDPVPPTITYSLFSENPVVGHVNDERCDEIASKSAVDEAMNVETIQQQNEKIAHASQEAIKKADLDDQLSIPSGLSTPFSLRTCSTIFSHSNDLRQPCAKSTTLYAVRDDVEMNVAQPDAELQNDVEHSISRQTNDVLTSSLETALPGVDKNNFNEMLNIDETKQEQGFLESQDKLQTKTFSAPQTDQERKDSITSISTSRQDNTSTFSASDNEHCIKPSMLTTASVSEKHCTPEVTLEDNAMTSLSQKQSSDDANNFNYSWSSQKLELIHDFIDEMRKQKEMNDKKRVTQTANLVEHSSIKPQRIESREMTLLENSVDVSHSNSLLIICRMLMNKEKYPPPDLLFLIMKKYLLECDNPHEVSGAALFLQSLLRLHPPSAPHILQDDIYAKAMSITSANDSVLLSLSKLSLSGEVRLWNDAEQVCAERNFFTTVLQQSMGILQGYMRHRHNAILLLAFFASILEQHQLLRDKIFWSNGEKSIKMLLRKFRNVVETNIKNKYIESSDSDDEIEIAGKETEDNRDDDDYRLEEIRLVGELIECLSRIIRSLFRNSDVKRSETSKVRRDVIGSLLAEIFRDADDKVVQTTLELIEFDLESDIMRIFLDSCFSDHLAKASKEEPLSLHTIVQRYFYFLPKLSTSASVVYRADAISKHDLSPPRQRRTSEDKSQIKRSPYFSDGKLSSANVNRRNYKGETALHRACILDQRDRVVSLLSTPGVDPNASDNAGWTPLSEACNLGHVDCVRELLKLPLKTKTSDPDEQPFLEIDLLSCPEEGTTPLHDTLSNGHVEVAKLLLEKGGVELLEVADKQGKTPLDACETEEIRSLVLELALDLSSKVCEQSTVDCSPNRSIIPTYYLPEQTKYAEVLPSIFSEEWLKSCRVFGILIQSLLMAYVKENDLLLLLIRISSKPSLKLGESESLRCYRSAVDNMNPKELEISRIEKDISYLLNWEEIETTFKQHLKIISGSNAFFDFSALCEDVRSILVNIF